MCRYEYGRGEALCPMSMKKKTLNFFFEIPINIFSLDEMTLYHLIKLVVSDVPCSAFQLRRFHSKFIAMIIITCRKEKYFFY